MNEIRHQALTNFCETKKNLQKLINQIRQTVSLKFCMIITTQPLRRRLKFIFKILNSVHDNARTINNTKNKKFAEKKIRMHEYYCDVAR